MPGSEATVAHHLHRLPDGIAGTIETLAEDAAPRRRYRDALTGLADGGEARRWVAQSIQRGTGTGLLLIAINKFELVNTAYGRATGDALLKAVARRIERVAIDGGGRRTLVARMAGAEFLVGVAPGMAVERIEMLAADIVESVARPFLSGDDTLTLGCRIGITVADEESCEVTDLLRRASAALAEAKEQDGAPIRRLSGDEAVAAGWDAKLAVDLRLALAQDEIEILFQPQVAIATGEIVGVEALARWQHPDYGELGASTLFAAAARSDHIVELSDHIQHRAIAIAAAWPQALKHLRLSVNIVAADIGRPGFADHFLAIADAAGFARVRLTVELTESGLIDDLNSAADLLGALRAGGCRVAIDDFGTGYSSLAYLKALPLDYLKIDKRLSEDITGSSRDRVVVRGVIEMARSLGLGVIAEGVETEKQLELLAQEGCTYYQGFLCAGPLTGEALAALVASRK
jgi:diguanylate cyclase (GGDEF)-like protein